MLRLVSPWENPGISTGPDRTQTRGNQHAATRATTPPVLLTPGRIYGSTIVVIPLSNMARHEGGLELARRFFLGWNPKQRRKSATDSAGPIRCAACSISYGKLSTAPEVRRLQRGYTPPAPLHTPTQPAPP